MLSSIVTHPGSAHKDEFLACSVLLADNHVTIFRREPSPEDLADPSICVVDAGHEHNPERNNFDHHQLPRDHAPTCSLSLVLQHLGLYDDSRQFCEWLETTEWMDCRGPHNTAKWLGVDREVLIKLNSPIDITLLRRFAFASKLEPGEPLWEIMKMIGEDLLNYVTSLRTRLNFIGQHAKLWDLEVGGKQSQVLFLPRTEPLPEEPSSGMDKYVSSLGLEEKIVATVYPDRRGTGYGLSRFRDNPGLNFTRISQEPDVHFAHAGGFVAKTSAVDSDRLKALLNQARENS